MKRAVRAPRRGSQAIKQVVVCAAERASYGPVAALGRFRRGPIARNIMAMGHRVETPLPSVAVRLVRGELPYVDTTVDAARLGARATHAHYIWFSSKG